ncbi:MAG: glycosyltransferase family 9 protein [Candidatus Omnitrophota bacterium]
MKKILLIRTDRIGDVILTLPAVHTLREQMPGAKISMLISPLTLDLVSGHPDIDEVLIDDKDGRHKGVRGFLKLVEEIRSKEFAVVINFHTKKRTNLLCFLSGIPHRIGYRNEKFGFLLTEKIPDVRPQGKKHESEYCFDLLKPLGISTGTLTMSLPYQESAEQWAAGFFQQLGVKTKGLKYVALHLGASCPTKRWPVMNFAALVRNIYDRHPVQFILIGTMDQKPLVVELKRIVPHVPFEDLSGKLSLSKTVSVIKRCDLLISNDSGPVHIAAAAGTPVVSIFTRNQPGINPGRWRPLGPCSVFVAPPQDMSISFAKGEVRDDRFLYCITPEQVLTVVDAVLQV